MPADAALEIEAMVSNSDIGFVSPGQEAEIKIPSISRATGSCTGACSASRTTPSTMKNATCLRRATIRSREFDDRDAGAGARLSSARLARPHPDADRGQIRRSVTRHVGHGRDQDRLTPHHRKRCSQATALSSEARM
nr:hypothetical protein [Mesorhizobium sp. B2-1-8]